MSVVVARVLRLLLTSSFLAFSDAGHAQQELLIQSAPGTGAETGQTTSIAQYDDWKVICETGPEGRTCRMSSEAEAGNIAVSLASQGAGGDAPLFFFLTPLDLLLPKGLELRIDAGPAQRLAFRSCHAHGCIAPFRLTGKLEDSFRRGLALQLRLHDLNDKPVDLTLSLRGFSAALEAISVN